MLVQSKPGLLSHCSRSNGLSGFYGQLLKSGALRGRACTRSGDHQCLVQRHNRHLVSIRPERSMDRQAPAAWYGQVSRVQNIGRQACDAGTAVTCGSI